MKIKKEYVIQELVDEFIVVPVGDEADRLHGVINLNETGAFLWNLLSQKEQTEDDLVNELVGKYTTDRDTARKDVAEFINTIKEYGCIN